MSAPLTAGEVVARIKSHLGFPWRETTYRDTFKFGGADTVVKGIATTMFCSYDTIRRAAAAGCNMIVPHEDTYWNDHDDISIVSEDPSYNRWRGFQPWPGAYTTLRGKKFIIHHMHTTDTTSSQTAGQLLVQGEELFAVCDEGSVLAFDEVQLEGKRRMSAAEFLRGYQIKSGEQLG